MPEQATKGYTGEGYTAVQAQPLSRREKEVLGIIASGKTSRETAELLCVTKRTIDFHIATCFRKLGASNRIQAILFARQNGFLS